jgi:hypothetical protein
MKIWPCPYDPGCLAPAGFVAPSLRASGGPRRRPAVAANAAAGRSLAAPAPGVARANSWSLPLAGFLAPTIRHRRGRRVAWGRGRRQRSRRPFRAWQAMYQLAMLSRARPDPAPGPDRLAAPKTSSFVPHIGQRVTGDRIVLVDSYIRHRTPEGGSAAAGDCSNRCPRPALSARAPVHATAPLGSAAVTPASRLNEWAMTGNRSEAPRIV